MFFSSLFLLITVYLVYFINVTNIKAKDDVKNRYTLFVIVLITDEIIRINVDYLCKKFDSSRSETGR